MMLRKITALLLAAVTALLLLSSCKKEEDTVLFTAVDVKAGVFDPQIVSDTTAITVVRNCFEGLVRLSDNGNVLPGVAESWSVSDDGLTYTFRLRKDAKWHLTTNAQDAVGENLPENFDLSVTAADFEFALRRACDSLTQSPEAFMLYNVENARAIIAGEKDSSELGVKATDKNTLVITLTAPQSNFLEILTEPMCMPCNETFFRACTGRYGRYIKYLLSNGPYYLSRLNEDSYRINKNPDYVGEAPVTSDAVWLYYVADSKTIIDDFKDGDYSCAVLSQYQFDNANLPSSVNVISTQNVLRCFIMNLQDETLSELSIRKALSCATDRELAASNAGMTPADGYVPACAADETVSIHPDEFDADAALKYFREGLTKLGVSTVSIEILCEADYEDMTKRMVQQWQKILGVDLGITIKTCTREELETAVKKGNYQIALASVTAETERAYEYFASFTDSSPYNTTGYSDTAIPGWLTKLYSGSEADYRAVYQAVEERLASAAFMLPLWEENTYFVSTVSPSRISFFTGRDKIYFR